MKKKTTTISLRLPIGKNNLNFFSLLVVSPHIILYMYLCALFNVKNLSHSNGVKCALSVHGVYHRIKVIHFIISS